MLEKIWLSQFPFIFWEIHVDTVRFIRSDLRFGKFAIHRICCTDYESHALPKKFAIIFELLYSILKFRFHKENMPGGVSRVPAPLHLFTLNVLMLNLTLIL